jgi:hypothetical protein
MAMGLETECVDEGVPKQVSAEDRVRIPVDWRQEFNRHSVSTQ